jgi:CRP/FNR family transcriptional regulator, cyclic AMP receptor protein
LHTAPLRVDADRVGTGGLAGWSWLLPPYQWVSGARCVTEVKAFQFNAQTVRHLCAADPALGDELTGRVFQVAAGRLGDTRTSLITRSHGTSPYATA